MAEREMDMDRPDGVDLGKVRAEIRAEASRLRLVPMTALPADLPGPDWAQLDRAMAMAGRQLALAAPPGRSPNLKARLKRVIRGLINPLWQRLAFPRRQYEFYLLQSIRAAAEGLGRLEARLDALEGRPGTPVRAGVVASAGTTS